MRGKTVVITGGTSGIGEEAAVTLARMGARTRRQEGLRSARDESRPHFPLGLERSPMQALFCFSNRVSPTAVSGGSGRNVGFAASVLIYQAQQRFRTANAYGIPVILERAVLLICSRHTTALSATGDRKGARSRGSYCDQIRLIVLRSPAPNIRLSGCIKTTHNN
jgi:hypothetical protein